MREIGFEVGNSGVEEKSEGIRGERKLSRDEGEEAMAKRERRRSIGVRGQRWVL